jgi:hypothetical protein
LFADEGVFPDFIPVLVEFNLEEVGTCTVVKLHPELQQYLIKVVIFFLHLLMVTPALLCFPCAYEISHALEDFVSPAKIFEDEVSIVDFQEPMVKPILFLRPVPLLRILRLF